MISEIKTLLMFYERAMTRNSCVYVRFSHTTEADGLVWGAWRSEHGQRQQVGYINPVSVNVAEFCVARDAYVRRSLSQSSVMTASCIISQSVN